MFLSAAIVFPHSSFFSSKFATRETKRKLRTFTTVSFKFQVLCSVCLVLSSLSNLLCLFSLQSPEFYTVFMESNREDCINSVSLNFLSVREENEIILLDYSILAEFNWQNFVSCFHSCPVLQKRFSRLRKVKELASQWWNVKLLEFGTHVGWTFQFKCAWSLPSVFSHVSKVATALQRSLFKENYFHLLEQLCQKSEEGFFLPENYWIGEL